MRKLVTAGCGLSSKLRNRRFGELSWRCKPLRLDGGCGICERNGI